MRRAALDIGSGATKIQVSDVDITTGKILNVLFVKRIGVKLREDLSKDLDEKFSLEIQNEMVRAISQLLSEAEAFNPQEYCALATEAFRIAKNANELVDLIKKETDLSVDIISQYEEGVLGLISAASEANIDPNKVVSWDCGGGSFQIATKCDNKYFVYQEKLGSTSFRNALLEIQGKNVNDAENISLNPISQEHVDIGIKFIKDNVTKIPSEIYQKLTEDDIAVLGIGLNPLWSMEDNIKFDKNRLLLEIKQRLNLDDNGVKEKIFSNKQWKEGIPYITSQLILAYGVMDTLQIQQVEFVGTPGGIATGALLYPKYWRN